MAEDGEDGGTFEVSEHVGPDTPGGAEVESFLRRSTDGHDAQVRKTSTMLGRSVVVGGSGTAILLPASLLAIVWLRRRREHPSRTPISGFGARLGWGRLTRTAPWYAWRPTRTKQRRVSRLRTQTQAQARILGGRVQARADQLRRRQTETVPVASPSRTSGNQMTLVALPLAVGLVGMGRWLDRQASKKQRT